MRMMEGAIAQVKEMAQAQAQQRVVPAPTDSEENCADNE